MADTIGDLVDKLTIANIRLWHLEDDRREYHDNPANKDKEEVTQMLSKVSATNRERNDLIDQINSSMRVLIDSKNGKDSTFTVSAEDLLGHGKNKFYKGEDFE